jgi:hypothetical protein
MADKPEAEENWLHTGQTFHECAGMEFMRLLFIAALKRLFD